MSDTPILITDEVQLEAIQAINRPKATNTYRLNDTAWLQVGDRQIYLFPNGRGFKLAIYPVPLNDNKPLHEMFISYHQDWECKEAALTPNDPGSTNTPYTLPIGRSAWIYAGSLAINLDAKPNGGVIDTYAGHLDAEPISRAYYSYENPQPAAARTAKQSDIQTITITAGTLTTQFVAPSWPAALTTYAALIDALHQCAALDQIMPATQEQPYDDDTN
jgi:hypothetical protein